MKRITRDNATVTNVGNHHAPAIKVAQGQSFTLETLDAAWGYFDSDDKLPYPDQRPSHTADPPHLNPLAGPVYIDGAQKGDIVIVSIEKIIPADSGYTILQPNDGLLGDSLKHSATSEYFTKILKHIPGESGTLADGLCQFNDKISWKLSPHIGTLCLAPEREVLASVSMQGSYGGNLDSRDFREGSKIWLTAHNDGGLLFAGDVHASMGDGEITDTADECASEFTLSCTVMKQRTIPHVRIERADAIIGLFCDKPLESAVKGAILNLLDWLTEDYGFDDREAYLLMGTCPDFRINIYQIVDFPGLSYTAGAELPLKYLK